MLSKEDNELLCRVGPGTAMGEMMRQYWLPALRSAEVSSPDAGPRRFRIMGENLLAFRKKTGEVAIYADKCPHRGASLFYARNEEDGVRCVYHGWKFASSGACVDMPTEPPDTNFKCKVKAKTYRTVERGGIVWIYMGGREVPPPLPDFESNMAADSKVVTVARHCNFMAAIEGDLDTAHFAFLHRGHLTVEDTYERTFAHYYIRERYAKYFARDTEYGTSYGARRPAEDDTFYWRIANYLFPIYTQLPTGALVTNRFFRAWVPIDDEHTMMFSVTASPAGGVVTMPERTREPPGGDAGRAPPSGLQLGTTEILPDNSDWLGRSVPRGNSSNDYLIDREMLLRRRSFTGIPSVALEDQAMTESMGAFPDRSNEQLAPSDVMVIQTRRRMLRAVKAWRDAGELPPGIDDPTIYRQRAGGVILSRSADWYEATAGIRRAFIEHDPELVFASIGEGAPFKV